MKVQLALQLQVLAVTILLFGSPSPASAGRTLHQHQFETARPTLPPFPTPDPNDPTCPAEIGFVAAGNDPSGYPQCAKTYFLAERKGDPSDINGSFSGEKTTESFELKMDSIHQWDGALLLRCYRQIKAYVEALAGGNAAADSSFLSPIMVMVTESGDFLATMEEIVAWFKGYFSNKPTVTVKVFNVGWTTDHSHAECTGVSMTIRAETNTHVVTFHTFWNRPRFQNWKLLKVLDVRVVSKN